MKKAEAQFTSKFRLWARDHIGNGAYEIKHTRGKDYFSMSELKEHQFAFLKAANGKTGISYKIPDDGVSYKPFDMFVMKRFPAYVVIAYKDLFAVIPVKRLSKWKEKTLYMGDAILMAYAMGAHKDLGCV